MKRIMLVLALMGVLSLAMANPLPPIYVSKFWIDVNGDLNLKFSDMMSYQTVSVDLFDGTNHYVDTIDFSNPANLIKIYPEAAVNAQQGYFSVTINQNADYPEEVHWGTDISNDLSPLVTGECGMQAYVAEGFENTVTKWVKELDIYPNSQWWPVAHSNIDVSVIDTFGNPVADYPVYVWFDYQPWDYTAENGHMLSEVFCSKLRIIVKHPQTQLALCDTTFFSEPGQNYSINVQFSDSEGEDPITPVMNGVFSIYPSVLRHGANDLHLAYNGKLQTKAIAELYDLKGRLVGKQDYTGTGIDWILPKLPSGVYFVQLIDGKQSLGTSKLIILK